MSMAEMTRPEIVNAVREVADEPISQLLNTRSPPLKSLGILMPPASQLGVKFSNKGKGESVAHPKAPRTQVVRLTADRSIRRRDHVCRGSYIVVASVIKSY